MALTAIKSGFTELRSREISELDAVLHEYIHEKSGARLVWLERKDENMTFCAAFRTLPYDDSGVFHILEHSVLCGSEKYPVKEPFLELMKGSLSTFLNAITYPDKTCYPVSSRNGQDFENLVRVYLDAVFAPRIYQMREIFAQEGWHFELDAEGRPSYKGVVFNEMKGAFSDPDTVLYNAMQKLLYPDNCYRFVSGGDPAAIPTLTYEKFLETHRRFYHPSNSYLYLDGSVDLARMLPLMEEYLDRYTRIDPDTDIALQKPVSPQRLTVDYELGEEEDAARKTKLGLGYVICDFSDRKTLMAAQALCDVLCGSNQAPLTRAILEKGLAEDVLMQLDDSQQQPWLLLQLQNLRQEDLETALDTLRETLQALCAEGLDHAQLEASLARMEFRLRECDFGTMPRGLVYGIEMLSTWLYGGDPADRLSIGSLFDELRALLDVGYYEMLLKTLLLDNPHRACVQLRPSKTLGAERQAQEQARLAACVQGWTDAQRREIQVLQASLEAWQHAPDSREALASIPQVTLSQISAEPEEIPAEPAPDCALPAVQHVINTGGIVYVNLYFDVDGLPEACIEDVSLLTSLLGQLGTAQLSMQELQKKLRLLTGGFQAGFSVYAGVNETQRSKLRVTVGFSALEGKLQEAAELACAILTETELSDHAEILNLLRQQREELYQSISTSTSFALGRAAAACSQADAYAERAGGLSFYRWLQKLETNFESERGALTKRLQTLAREIFSAGRLSFSTTGTFPGAPALLGEIFSRRLTDAAWPYGTQNRLQMLPPCRLGIQAATDVSYAVQGGALTQFGGGYSGKMYAVSRIATLAYLWNVVRVQGGAYGTGLTLRNSGLAACTSYRDPTAARSLELYEKTAQFLRQFAQEGQPLDSYLIGALSRYMPLLTPSLKGCISDIRALQGVTREMLRTSIAQILSLTHEDILACCDSLEQTIAEGSVVVIGGKKQLEACGTRLDEIVVL